MKSPSNCDFAIADGISNFNLQPHRTIDNHDAENEGFEDTLQVSENHSGTIQNRVDTPAYPSNGDKPVVGGTEDVNKGTIKARRPRGVFNLRSIKAANNTMNNKNKPDSSHSFQMTGDRHPNTADDKQLTKNCADVARPTLKRMQAMWKDEVIQERLTRAQELPIQTTTKPTKKMNSTRQNDNTSPSSACSNEGRPSEAELKREIQIAKLQSFLHGCGLGPAIDKPNDTKRKRAPKRKIADTTTNTQSTRRSTRERNPTYKTSQQTPPQGVKMPSKTLSLSCEGQGTIKLFDQRNETDKNITTVNGISEIKSTDGLGKCCFSNTCEKKPHINSTTTTYDTNHI